MFGLKFLAPRHKIVVTMASLVRLRLAVGRSLRPRITTRHGSYSSAAPLSSIRSFSTPAAATKETITVDIPSDATSAGKVLDFLNTQCKDELTNAHIQALVKACDSPEDYPKILHAITTFKRTRNYVMDTETADTLIATVVDKSPSSAEGALWVLENFKERTGLYYSATVYALNRALDSLWNQVERGGSSVEDTERVWKALEKVSSKLIQRQTLRGARGMSKRAKREYLKCLQNKGGPTEHTVRRIAQIGATVKTPEETSATFIAPFQAANVWIHPKTLEWLEEQQVVEQVEEESEEGSEGDADQSSSEEPEADSAEEGSEEEKKE